MIRQAVVVVAVCLLPACRCDSKKSAAPAVASDGGATASATPHERKPTDPDPDYEKNRAELLKRGNPDMMKDAPVVNADQLPAEASATDLVKAVSKDVMMVKSIRVDLAKHRLEVPGKVILTNNAVLEFIAVGAHGKGYESLFTVDATAVELRLALTLLGHEGDMPDDKGALPKPSPGQTMHALVKVGDGPEEPLSAFLLDRGTKKSPPDLEFQIVGFKDADKSEALREEQFISLVAHESTAALRATTDTGNPYAGADQGLTGSKKVPALGTAITLVLEDSSP